MTGRGDGDEQIAVNHLGFEAVVIDGERDDAEVDGVFENRFEDSRIVGALDADRDAGIVALELGEDLGEDVEAGAFVGADDDFAARDALGFGDLGEDIFAVLDSFFGVLIKELAGGGDGDAASRAVEEAGADLFFEGANLRGDGGLRTEALLGGAGKAGEARDLQENF